MTLHYYLLVKQKSELKLSGLVHFPPTFVSCRLFSILPPRIDFLTQRNITSFAFFSLCIDPETPFLNSNMNAQTLTHHHSSSLIYAL